MLAIEPARQPRAGKGKLAIALAGGGPLGAFYELGALHALGEAIVGRELTSFDVYVGVSSGSLVAAGLANGFDTASLGSTFISGESTLLPFSPELLLRPATSEYLRRLALLPDSLASVIRQYSRDPVNTSWPIALGSLSKALPTALFENHSLERYLHRMFTTNDHTDSFRELRPQLFVVATNLNTGESVAFGDATHRHVPISRAIVASAALPGLYPSVQIDGQHYVDGALIRTMHASLALEAGCDLVICINPLVPFHASPSRRHRPNLAHEGLPTILGQTFRALIHSRMLIGMASYGSRFPQADTLLLEPDRKDERLFFTNVFRYSGRHRLADHAYQRTRHDLLAQSGQLRSLLERHGLGLNMKLLRDRRRTFTTAAAERAARTRLAARRLGRALSRLEYIVAAETRRKRS